MEDFNFDWRFYLNYNNEACRHVENSERDARIHYDSHGMKDGLFCCEEMLYKHYPFLRFFDWEHYRDNNSDFKNMTKYELFHYYLRNAKSEHRPTSFSLPLSNFLVNNRMISTEHKHKVSVIVPVYNRPELVKDSLDSILNQTYTNIELIIVDDCSNIETKRMLQNYELPNVTIITNDINLGCYTSINIALSICKGDFITVQKSDDISLYDRIEKMVNVMEKERLSMTGTYIMRTHFPTIGNFKNKRFSEVFPLITTMDMGDVTHTSECCKELVSLGTLMYRRSVFKKLGTFPNIRIGGDMVFFEKFLKSYENIRFAKDDCSHRYLTYHNKGSHYKIIKEILYLSPEMTSDNVSNKPNNFSIAKYRTTK